MSKHEDFISNHAAGVRLNIKVRPGARAGHDAPKIVPVPGGRHALEIAVTARAERGKANHAIIALLAQRLGLTRSNFSMVAGATARYKIVEISGEAETIRRRICAWLAATAPSSTTNQPT